MFNKMFLGFYALAILVMGILTYIPFDWLQRKGFAPSIIVQTFEYWENWHFTVLWISSLILLGLSNVILWKNRKAWAIWLSFVYFAVFLMLNTWWLNESLFAYKKQNNLWDGSFQIGGIFGAFMCVIIGIGTFFNQFLVLRIREKLLGNSNDTSKSAQEMTTEEIAK